MNHRALVVFSGGQDSTTILAHALHLGFECEAIGFNYGQKHAVELQQAQKIADKLHVPYRIVDMKEFGNLVAGSTALVGNGVGLSVDDPSPMKHMSTEVHASFVPNRNAMMLTMAHGYAQIIGADTLWTGVCQTDYSGYPDCRKVFIDALEKALNVGYETNIQIITPLMYATKAETFKMAEHARALDLVLEESHTCYNGVRGVPHDYRDPASETYHGFHEWGHGCGECAACELRAKGWREYKAMEHIAEGRVTGNY
jgi:7-cyano-7-deazaguanine synthase